MSAAACTSSLRELRASARRAVSEGRSRAGRHAARARARRGARDGSSERSARERELERLALALAAHDPERTLARGYALVEDRDGEPLRVGRRGARAPATSGCASTTTPSTPRCDEH